MTATSYIQSISRARLERRVWEHLDRARTDCHISNRQYTAIQAAAKLRAGAIRAGLHIGYMDLLTIAGRAYTMPEALHATAETFYSMAGR